MSPDSHTRRLAAIFFADVAGFTRLTAGDEALAYSVVEALRGCSRGVVGAYGGSIVKFLGDGVMAEFSSAEGAVSAALLLRESFRLATADLRDGPYHLHTGVNLGEVTIADDGDLFGDGVNRAARLQDLAEYGQVLVGEEIQRLLRQRTSFRFRDSGLRTAPGLVEPFRVFAVSPADAHREHLEGRAEELAREARRGPPPHPTFFGTLVENARAVAVGLTAGLVLFFSLVVWSAMAPPGSGRTSAAAEPGDGELPAQVQLPPLLADDAAYASLAPLPLPEPAATAPEKLTFEPPPEASSPERPLPTVDTSDPVLQLEAMSRSAAERYPEVPPVLAGWPLLLPRLRRAAEEARAGTPTPARMHTLRGLLLFASERRLEEAEDAFREAGSLADGGHAVRQLHAMLLLAQGRTGEAGWQIQEAERLGAPEEEVRLVQAIWRFRSGALREAEGLLEDIVEDSPHDVAARVLLSRTRSARGEHDDAVKALQPAAASGSIPALVWMARALTLRDGTDLEAGAARQRALELADRESGDLVLAYPLALMHLAAGDSDAAFGMLDRAIAAGSPDVLWLMVDPGWEPVRTDPSYTARVARLGLEPPG